MNGPERLPNFNYRYSCGPLPTDLLQEIPTEGNCRLAVQIYFNRIHGIDLRREDILLPEAKNIGIFIERGQESAIDFLNNLQEEDIVYADNLLTISEKKVRPAKEKFPIENDRLLNLHLAIYLGMPTNDTLSRFLDIYEGEKEKSIIWHASFIAGRTELWMIDKFCHYYNPIFARRILN